MKKFLLILSCLLIAFQAYSQTERVYLKNGSIINGSLTDFQVGGNVKIETRDGNVFVYKVSEISNIEKIVSENNGSTDIVNLKNGGKIKGHVIEYMPSVKVETIDESVFVYNLSEVTNIEKIAGTQAVAKVAETPSATSKVPATSVSNSSKVPQGWPAHEMYRKGHFLYQNGVQLVAEEIEGVMGTDYAETYISAVRQSAAGKTEWIYGACFVGLGLVCDIVGAAVVVPELSYVGAGFLLGGNICAGLGIVFNIVGNSRLKWIANSYNEHSFASTLNIDLEPALIASTSMNNVTMAPGLSLKINF